VKSSKHTFLIWQFRKSQSWERREINDNRPKLENERLSQTNRKFISRERFVVADNLDHFGGEKAEMFWIKPIVVIKCQ
jgi:uncharacterized protein (DUF2384 family)